MDERKKGFLEALKAQFKGYDTENLDKVRAKKQRVEQAMEKIYMPESKRQDARAVGAGLLKEEDYKKKWKKPEA